MYTLTLFNKYATIERKFYKAKFKTMLAYAKKVSKEQNMQYKYHFEAINVKIN